MKHIETCTYSEKSYRVFALNRTNFPYHVLLLFLGIWLIGCSDFVEVDPPKNVLISETVFDDPATVESALANLYYGMREAGMVSGSFGLTTALGIYSDELDYYALDVDYAQMYHHNVIPGNNRILDWWNQGYELIYGANDIIKGVENSQALTADEKNRFMGQALFIRAFIHSLLVSLYGDIPYIQTTDYSTNSVATRLPLETVFNLIIADLLEATEALENSESVSSDKVIPDQWAAKALLARMYLYTENWEPAGSAATGLIDTFGLEPETNEVFLKESTETIWQLKADEEFPKNTREAVQLIIPAIPGQTYAITNDLLTAFEDGDLRKTSWLDSISDSAGAVTLYYAHKYKAGINETESLEYSIVFRLAEQYLIRAEARAHLGDIAGAQEDMNRIRNRAGLGNTSANTITALLDDINRERRVELFTEHGQRWFDLKRTGQANEVMGSIKPNWRGTNVLLPIPEAELELNPNLLPQNEGY